MKIDKYLEFLKESNGTLRLFYSEEFREIIKIVSLNNNSTAASIAVLILNSENTNYVEDKYTLIDITNKNDEVSYAQVNRILKDLEENTEFRIKWPRGEMGTLPADSEQYMLIEDLYGSVEKIQKQLDNMMNNKINIEFLQKQVEKMLNDIEELKDADREIKNGH